MLPNVKAAQIMGEAAEKLQGQRPNDDLVPGVASYGILSQCNPEYDEKLLRQLDVLYKGGYAAMRSAKHYLPRLVGEGDDRYGERCAIGTYQPYFGQIVDQFVSDVFEKQFSITPESDADDKATPGTDTDVTVDDFWTAFENDADGKGLSIEHLMRHVLRTALVHKLAVVIVDTPRSDADPVNRAEEEASGLRLYAYECPVDELIDWERDDDGNLTFVVLRTAERKRGSPLEKRETITERFTVWTSEGGTIAWAKYEISYKPDDPPKHDAMCQRVDTGTLEGFDAIPVHICELPDGLWVGNKIGPLAIEHWRRRSTLIGSENRSLCAIPYVALGSELGAPGGALPSAVQQDPGRGDSPLAKFNRQGYLVVGSDDKVGFAEPSGACYELVQKQLNELRDDMFSVNHQMAASVRPTTTALGRSGLSKQKDQDSTARVLTALGQHIAEFALEIYECVARARGEDIKWATHGLDDYSPYDRESLLEEAVSLDAVQIPSPTFRKKHKYEIARRLLPSATPQELDVIRQEIEDGVESEQEMRDLTDEAKAAQTSAIIENPSPTPAGPPKMPSAKNPTTKPPSPPKPGPKKA